MVLAGLVMRKILRVRQLARTNDFHVRLHCKDNTGQQKILLINISSIFTSSFQNRWLKFFTCNGLSAEEFLFSARFQYTITQKFYHCAHFCGSYR